MQTLANVAQKAVLLAPSHPGCCPAARGESTNSGSNGGIELRGDL